MSVLIPNGTYKISNASKHKYVADLYNGFKFGAITAYEYHGGNNQKWDIRNLGNNQVIIQNLSTNPGAFATVYSESRGAGLSGSTNSTVWTVQSAGKGKYHITTVDGGLAWYINKDGDDVVVNLEPLSNNPGEKAEWEITHA